MEATQSLNWLCADTYVPSVFLLQSEAEINKNNMTWESGVARNTCLNATEASIKHLQSLISAGALNKHKNGKNLQPHVRGVLQSTTASGFVFRFHVCQAEKKLQTNRNFPLSFNITVRKNASQV